MIYFFAFAYILFSAINAPDMKLQYTQIMEEESAITKNGNLLTCQSQTVSRKTLKTINNIVKQIEKCNGRPPQGYKGGKTFRNSNQILPTHLTYKEYDIYPYTKGVNRGAERIVIGSDTSIWYTKDHYNSFIQITQVRGL